jgi:16S rRNA (uracil1498-N3)-methyltransferase
MTVSLASEEARHLRDVLRLKPGDEAFVFDGEGREYRCRVAEQTRDGALLEIEEEVAAERPESPLRLTLGVALLKGEKFDLVVQKATELGVARIVPVAAKLSDVRIKDVSDAARRVARWKRIALEALKQSGRARLPEVIGPTAFAALVESSGPNEGCRLVFSERDGRGLLETAGQWPEGCAMVTALIGPEGGWADEELAHAKACGWSIVTLGGRRLRAETAAIAAATLLQHLFGDLL